MPRGDRKIHVSKAETHYETLHLLPSASQRQIESAYRVLALELHPDTNASADATQRFMHVHSAYVVLRDPVTRGAYDQRLDPRVPRAPAATPTDRATMRRTAVLLLAALAVGGFWYSSSRGSAGASPTATPTLPSFGASPAAVASVAPAPLLTARAGQDITYSDGWAIQVIRWNEQSPNAYGRAPSGMRLVTFTVAAANTASAGIEQLSFKDFRAYDSSGRELLPVAMLTGDELILESVGPGQSIQRTVTFAAPETERRFRVVYQRAGYEQATISLD